MASRSNRIAPQRRDKRIRQKNAWLYMRRNCAACNRNSHEHASPNFAQSRNIRVRGSFPTLSLRRRFGIFGRNRFKRNGRRKRGAGGIAKIVGGVIRPPRKKSHTKLCGFFQSFRYCALPTRHIHSASAASSSPTNALPDCFTIRSETRRFLISIRTVSPGRTW